MNESCILDPHKARKIHSLVLRRLASIGQSRVADALQTSETTISRWKDDRSEFAASVIAALGLKVVPADHVCYSAEHIAHLEYFAKRGMQMEAPALEWGDE